ncbi:hypothetical protein EC973_000484 [Apophysomyces ossiformis]|uniref:Uncharacterized protein n=1 Tax=Apophysomyces ossiformis TaxID=679940 RepID=A0A8H7BLH8_9FUNG|nr:hypothetical protein EC973_000484 [Apophysomyces ossiformis]
MTTSDVRPPTNPFEDPSSGGANPALLGCGEMYRFQSVHYNSSSNCTYDPLPPPPPPPPPSRQLIDASCQERTVMIENLVETSVEILNSIWHPQQQAKVVSTQGFVREILKRSKTTYVMLQIALFYIFRIKQLVTQKLRERSQYPLKAGRPEDNLICCGRRMFLAALIVASKYLHDKAYRNKAWAQIAGLSLTEINTAERTFLQMIDYRLHVSKASYDKWCGLLNGYIQRQKTSAAATLPSGYPTSIAQGTNVSTTHSITAAGSDASNNSLPSPTPSASSPLSPHPNLTAQSTHVVHRPSPSIPRSILPWNAVAPLTPEFSPVQTTKRVMEDLIHSDHTAKRIRQTY